MGERVQNENEEYASATICRCLASQCESENAEDSIEYLTSRFTSDNQLLGHRFFDQRATPYLLMKRA